MQTYVGDGLVFRHHPAHNPVFGPVVAPQEYLLCGEQSRGNEIVHLSAERDDKRIVVRSTGADTITVTFNGRDACLARNDSFVPREPEPLGVRNVVEYALKCDEDGTVVVVLADKHAVEEYYESFRLFHGIGELHESRVTNVIRYRDGGTTDVTTATGALHVPYEGEATWNGRRVRHGPFAVPPCRLVALDGSVLHAEVYGDDEVD